MRREADGGRLEMEASRVALVGGRIVGACLANAGPDGLARVGATAVLAEARRRGVGGRMVSEVVRALEGGGARHITLEVARENRAAVALYESLGFEAGRGLRILSGRRSDLRCGPVPAARIEREVALEALAGLHPEVPAFQRRGCFVGSFREGVICHGVRREGVVVGVVMQRGRAVLDYGARPADDDVVAALAWAAGGFAWVQRLINVVEDDPVGDCLLRIGFTVESEAMEMVRVGP